MRMPGMMAVGGSAKFAIDDDLKTALTTACGADNIRGLKIDVDIKGEKLKLGGVVPLGQNMDEDFKNMIILFEDAIPCLILLKLKPAPGDDDTLPAEDGDWSLLSWIPEDTPPKPKMIVSSTQKTVKDAFAAEVTFRKDYKMVERSEATFAAWKEATQTLTGDDRKAAMSRQEQMQEEANEAIESERASLGKKQLGLAGLGSVTCTAHETFEDNVKKVASGSGGEAVIGKITGTPGNHQVEGDILGGVNKPSDLKGKLSDEIPCYVVMQGEDGLLLISWLPDTAAVKPRMNVSTYKRDVCEKIKAYTGKEELLEQQCSEDDELTDDLGKKAVASSAPQTTTKPAMTGPMAGAIKMPGMP